MIIEARSQIQSEQPIFAEMIKDLPPKMQIARLDADFSADLDPITESNPQKKVVRNFIECVYKGFMPRYRECYEFDPIQKRYVLMSYTDSLSGSDLSKYIIEDPHIDLAIKNLKRRGGKPRYQNYQAFSTISVEELIKLFKDMREEGFKMDKTHLSTPRTNNYSNRTEILFYPSSGIYCTSLSVDSLDDPINKELIDWVKRQEKRFNLKVSRKEKVEE